MPLTLKLRADYTERINEQLDKIPIESDEDFKLASESLQNILNAEPGFEVPAKYNDRMFEIQDSLDCPEEYVEEEADFAEYQDIIRTRIASKIEELKALNASQKENYARNQQELREHALANHEVMAQHMPPEPGSEAHVVSERQWHMLMQYAYLSELYEEGDAPMAIRISVRPEITIDEDEVFESRAALGVLTEAYQSQSTEYHHQQLREENDSLRRANAHGYDEDLDDGWENESVNSDDDELADSPAGYILCPRPEPFSVRDEFIAKLPEMDFRASDLWRNCFLNYPEPNVIVVGHMVQHRRANLLEISDSGIKLLPAFFHEDNIPISEKVDLVMQCLNISPTSCPEEMRISLARPSDARMGHNSDLVKALEDKFDEIKSDFEETSGAGPGR